MGVFGSAFSTVVSKTSEESRQMPCGASDSFRRTWHPHRENELKAVFPLPRWDGHGTHTAL
jgi:hypothetical protein